MVFGFRMLAILGYGAVRRYKQSGYEETLVTHNDSEDQDDLIQ